MVGPKSTQTRVVGIITDEMHPYIQFLSNRVSMKKCVGMHLVCYFMCTIRDIVHVHVHVYPVRVHGWAWYAYGSYLYMYVQVHVHVPSFKHKCMYMYLYNSDISLHNTCISHVHVHCIIL